MDDKKALEIMNSLLKTGGLAHITATHKCGIPTNQKDPRTPEEAAKCAAYQFPTTHHLHFVALPIVKIEKSKVKEGVYRAWTEDGSWREGYPPALLKRLTEATLAG